MSVSFSVIGDDCQRLFHEDELALLRVAQEALANIRKHAQARRVTGAVDLAGRQRRCSCTITDDGRGFDPELQRSAPMLRASIWAWPCCGSGWRCWAGNSPWCRSRGRAQRYVRRCRCERTGVTIMGKIRILIVDDHALFRDGLRAVLEHQEDMSLVGEASDAGSAIRLAAELRPDRDPDGSAVARTERRRGDA